MNGRVAILAAAVGLVAIGIRIPHLDDGFTGNELANLRSLVPWYSELFDRENGVNPPLLRLLIHPLPEAWVLPGARWLSVLCSSLAAAALAVYAHRHSRSWALATLCGLVLATQPMSVTTGSLARAYALWMLVFAGTLHAWDRRHSAGLAAGLALQPWCHYLPGPVAALTAVWAWHRGRLTTRHLVGIGLAWLPLAGFVATNGEAREARTSLEATARYLYTLGWSQWAPWLAPLLLVSAALVTRRRLPHLWALGYALTILAAASVHIVRPPVALFVLLPLVVAVAAIEPEAPPWKRLLATAALGCAVAYGVRELGAPSHRDPTVDGVPRLAQRWGEIRAQTPGPVVVHQALGSLFYRMTGINPCRDGGPDCALRSGHATTLDGVSVCPPPCEASMHLTLGSALAGCEIVLADELFYLQSCP